MKIAINASTVANKERAFFTKVVNQMFTIASISQTLEKAEKLYPANWWTKYSMSRANKETFRTYFLKEGRRDFKWSNARAQQEFLRWFQDWGLRVV